MSLPLEMRFHPVMILKIRFSQNKKSTKLMGIYLKGLGTMAFLYENTDFRILNHFFKNLRIDNVCNMYFF